MHLLNTNNKAPQNILKTNKQLLMNKSIKNSKCIFTNQAIKLLLNYPWLYLSLMTELGMLIFICLSMRLNLIHGQFKVKDPQVYLQFVLEFFPFSQYFLLGCLRYQRLILIVPQEDQSHSLISECQMGRCSLE